LKVAIASKTSEAAQVIRQLLLPWDVSFTSPDEAEVVIAYKEKPSESNNTIVVPSDSLSFLKWAKDARLRVRSEIGERTCIVVEEKMSLTILPHMLYCYDEHARSTSGSGISTHVKIKENLAILTLDVINEYTHILKRTLNAKGSRIYRVSTGLPIPYSIAPKQIRGLLMKGHKESKDLTFKDRLPLDAIRFILLRAMEKLSKKKISRKAWNQKRFACVITHDVETRDGLQKAGRFIRLEEKYNVPSAWYVPSKHYRLDLEKIRELANHGEVGAHDTKHDGKLNRLPKQKIVERLKEAKQTLEEAAHCSIMGFRAPLLQHNCDIIQALHESGYAYDTSIPTWEPKHPFTMRPHGIGTIYPLTLNGIIEIPVTMPQDHQMIHSLGISPRGTVEAWAKLMKETEAIGGLCVLLTHPDYELANPENLGTYEDLLNIITSNSGAYVALPKNLVKNIYD
jgi:peptidoglycan/xylan/chitin deacetylase (PgdA/CDA1 family)